MLKDIGDEERMFGPLQRMRLKKVGTMLIVIEERKSVGYFYGDKWHVTSGAMESIILFLNDVEVMMPYSTKTIFIRTKPTIGFDVDLNGYLIKSRLHFVKYKEGGK